MRVFVIGSGGREHALCWKLAKSSGAQIFAAPGNPGIAQVANTFQTTDYLAVAQRIRPDLTIVGPEQPLATGVVDLFRSNGFAIIGPVSTAAQLETSKTFSKAVMDQAEIPTAPYTTADSYEHGVSLLPDFGLPVVLKADGLAAGKGVIIAHSRYDAEAALRILFGTSKRVIIEEHLTGEEVSFIVLTDGQHVLPLEPSQDHKRIHDGDKGPNTGGMGAYSDSRILNDTVRGQIMDTIIEPVISHMRSHHHPYTGFLYAGLMMTDAGPRVLEFNARLGDPETQALVLRMSSDLLPVLQACAQGRLPQATLEWSPNPSVCVVLAAHGYPVDARAGDPIHGIEHVKHGVVFHAGTKLTNNVLTTSGGRVLGVCSSAPTLPAAIDTVYKEVRHIHFDGMQYRRDIGRNGLERW
jgi:phosphoribosylamine--glycine ligase